MDYCYFDSPIGPLLLAGNAKDEALSFIGFPKGKGRLEPRSNWRKKDQSLAQAKKQLSEYFARTRKVFDLPLHPTGTDFQLDVLDALQTIPYGQTRSYGEIAEQIGRPAAIRAVGAANGRNPIPIVIPCHRVIGANGSLTGFGGGLEAKQFLLQLESHDREV